MEKKTEGVILEAVLRTSQGKGPTGALRRAGWIPGVLYGKGSPSLPVQVQARPLARILHTKAGGNVLITLQVKSDGDKKPTEAPVLIKELQHHPVSHQIIHIDFHQVSLTQRITVTVRLAFQGEAAGVKSGEGILEHLRWDLEVECLPTQIPAEIPVDLSSLEVGQTLHAKAIPMPPGVRRVTDPESPVVACVVPKEEVIEAAPAEAATEAAEPEVLKQKKPEEIAAEEAQAKEKAGPKGAEKQEKEKRAPERAEGKKG